MFAEKEGDGFSLRESYEDSKVEVWLEGKKLRGSYAFIRTQSGEDERWLFTKMKDDEADARRNPAITEPKSVLSGRTLEEVRLRTGPNAFHANRPPAWPCRRAVFASRLNLLNRDISF